MVTNNPPGVAYKAVLPESAFFQPAFPEGGNIHGEVVAVANSDGRGVLFTVKLRNLPKISAALRRPPPSHPTKRRTHFADALSHTAYHLHVAPVPEDGNCTETLGRVDPYIRGQTPPCNMAAPATCQVGDLSGKHGAIPTNVSEWETSYIDLYASTLQGIGAFFGNRSLVIHYPNLTRITCASFARVNSSVVVPNGTTTPRPTGALLLRWLLSYRRPRAR